MVLSLLPEEIEYMHWGIINEYNFKGLKYLPRKVNDPLFTNPNDLKTNNYGPIVLISPTRSARPVENNNGGDYRPEVFREIVEGRSYEICLAKDDVVYNDNVFSDSPLRQDLSNYDAVTVVNKYPAGIRVVDDFVKKNINCVNNLCYMINLVSFHTKLPKELSVIENADSLGVLDRLKYYHQYLSRTPVSHISSVLKTMQSGINVCIEESVKKGVGEIVIDPFFNLGYLAGSSLRRFHSQVYMDLTQTGHDTDLEALLKSYCNENNDCCLLCESEHEGRLVYENDSFVLWVTQAPRRDFHLRAAPKNHVDSFRNLTGKEVGGLADVLKIAGLSLNKLSRVSASGNIIFRTLPYGYEPHDRENNFHFFVDILPFETVGGYELSGDKMVARVHPWEAAEVVKKEVDNIFNDDYDFSDYEY